MKRIYTAIFLCFLSCLCLHAQGSEGVVMPFSQTPRDPASLALGATQAGHRALGVFSMPQIDGLVSYQAWQPQSLLGSSNLAARVGYRIKDGLSVRLFFAQDQAKAFDVADGEGQTVTSFTPHDLKVGAGLSWRLQDFVGISADASYLSSALAPGADYAAFAADVLLCGRYEAVRGMAGVTSVGSKVTSGDRSFALPAAFVLGFGYEEQLSESFGIDFMAEGDFYFYGSYRIAAGIEAGISDLVFLRAGYNYGAYDSILPSFASIGLGVKVAGCRLDAAYLLGNLPMGGSFQVGLGYSF